MLEQFTDSINKLTDKLASWVDQLILMFPNFVLSILLIITFIFLAKLVRRLSAKTFRRISENVAINQLLSNLIYIGVITIGIFVALGVLQLSKTVTSLLAGVGVLGLALGFAFQNTAANFISGIFMATRHPINVGDLVEANEHFGTVEIIDMRFTKIRSPQGQVIVIPNRTILENPLINYSSSGERRVDLECGISYGDDLIKVRDVVMSVLQNEVEFNHDKQIDFMYTEFGSSSINFVLRFWLNSTSQKEYLMAKSEAVIAIKRAFDKNEISIPFPIRTLDFGIKGGLSLEDALPANILE
ncbi:MAG: mechanosensitive ion channel protein [Cyclobacteriaceae bacterium]|nr:MAG: mechanosensitive ion channel protein [Cyclobacteriaceae bacterium]